MHPVYEQLKFVLGLKPISILVPRIWFQVPHPSNGQNMAKTKPFRRQKRRFLDGARFQDFWLRGLPLPVRDLAHGPKRGNFQSHLSGLGRNSTELPNRTITEATRHHIVNSTIQHFGNRQKGHQLKQKQQNKTNATSPPEINPLLPYITRNK